MPESNRRNERPASRISSPSNRNFLGSSHLEQERVSQAKELVKHLRSGFETAMLPFCQLSVSRSELCDRNFLSLEIDRELLTEVFRFFAPEVAERKHYLFASFSQCMELLRFSIFYNRSAKPVPSCFSYLWSLDVHFTAVSKTHGLQSAKPMREPILQRELLSILPAS